MRRTGRRTGGPPETVALIGTVHGLGLPRRGQLRRV